MCGCRINARLRLTADQCPDRLGSKGRLSRRHATPFTLPRAAPCCAAAGRSSPPPALPNAFSDTTTTTICAHAGETPTAQCPPDLRKILSRAPQPLHRQSVAGHELDPIPPGLMTKQRAFLEVVLAITSRSEFRNWKKTSSPLLSTSATTPSRTRSAS